MAKDYRSVRTFPAIKEFTSSTNWEKIQLPSNCSSVQVGSTSALYIASSASDGVAVQPTDEKGFIVASNYLTFKIGKGSTRDSDIYVASQSGTPKISIIIEE